MEATTTNFHCHKCKDRGVVNEIVPSGFLVHSCDCRTPEYWRQRSKEKIKALRARLKEDMKKFEGLDDGQETKKEKS